VSCLVASVWSLSQLHCGGHGHGELPCGLLSSHTLFTGHPEAHPEPSDFFRNLGITYLMTTLQKYGLSCSVSHVLNNAILKDSKKAEVPLTQLSILSTYT
jgi:hypothetical protein